MLQHPWLADLCFRLVLCPPTIEKTTDGYEVLKYDLHNEQDQRLQATVTRCSIKQDVPKLRANKLRAVLSVLPQLKHLHLAGFAFDAVYGALQSAPFKTSLTRLHLTDLYLSSKQLPLLELQQSGYLPNLEYIQVCEQPRKRRPKDHTASSPEVCATLSSRFERVLRSTRSADVSVRAEWRSLHTLALRSKISDPATDSFWTLADARREFARLALVGGTLRHLSLALPTHYCCVLVDCLKDTVLRQITELELKLECATHLVETITD